MKKFCWTNNLNRSFIIFFSAAVNLRCDHQSITFEGSKKYFPGWRATEIKLGKCPLKEDYMITAMYNECGVVITEDGKIFFIFNYSFN